MQVKQESSRQFCSWLTLVGFSNIVIASQVWPRVRGEVNEILVRNHIQPLAGNRQTGEGTVFWDSPNYLDINVDLERSLSYVVDRQVYVFREVWNDNGNVASATIQEDKLKQLLDPTKPKCDVYIYVPDVAFISLVRESENYVPPNRELVKLFLGPVKTQLI